MGDRLTKCCSQVIFNYKFLVTYSARLLFHFCVADLKATQNVQNQPCTNFGRQGSTFKSKAIYFLKGYSAFLQRHRRNVKIFCFFKPSKKFLSRVPKEKKNLSSTSSAIVCLTVGLGFCTKFNVGCFIKKTKQFSFLGRVGSYKFPFLI